MRRPATMASRRARTSGLGSGWRIMMGESDPPARARQASPIPDRLQGATMQSIPATSDPALLERCLVMECEPSIPRPASRIRCSP